MRVQVGDLSGPEALRPQQQTGDTYVKPEQAPINNDWERLSGALGQFSSSLASLGRVLNKAPKDDPREAQAREIALSMGPSELMTQANNGTLPWQNVPVVDAFYKAQAGKRAAEDRISPLKLGLSQGTVSLLDDNGQPRPVDTILQQHMVEGLKSVGKLRQSEHFMKSYYNAYESQGVDIRKSAQEQQAKLNSDTLKNIAAEAMDGYLTTDAKHQDPNERVNGLMKTYDRIRQVYGPSFPNAAIEDVLMGRLRASVERDPDTVVRILNMDRGAGRDGQPLGSIANNGRLSTFARELMIDATKKMASNFDTAQQSHAANVALEAFKRGDGSFHQLQDQTYTNPHALLGEREKKISASSAKELALARYETESSAALSSQRVPDDQAKEVVFDRMANAFIGSNHPNPKWSSAITDAGRVLGNEMDASKPENLPRLKAAAELYRKIEDRNPGYANETMKVGAKEKEFFTMARFYEEDMGQPADVALQKAAMHVARPKVPLNAETKEKIESGSKSVSSGFFAGFIPYQPNTATTVDYGESWNPFKPNPQNVMDIQRRVKAVAETLASDQGIPPEKAVESAFKIVQRQSTLINGQAFHGDPHITKETKPTVENFLKESAAKYGGNLRTSDGEPYKGELSLKPLTGKRGMYVLTTPNGEALGSAKPGGGFGLHYVTGQDIQDLKKAEQEQRITDTQLEQKKASMPLEWARATDDMVPKDIRDAAKAKLKAAGIFAETPSEKAAREAQEAIPADNIARMQPGPFDTIGNAYRRGSNKVFNKIFGANFTDP